MTDRASGSEPEEGGRLEVRQVPQDQCAEVAVLHAACFDQPWSEAEIEKVMQMPGMITLIAGQKKQQGFVMLRSGGGEAEIISIGVRPEYRGQRLAEKLLDAAFAHLLAAGSLTSLPPIYLEVAEDNDPAQKLYHRMGFKVVGKRVNYYRRPDGSRVDALTMCLKIDDLSDETRG